MARPFIEDRISMEANHGSSLSQSFNVSNTQTSSGDTFGVIFNPYPVLRYQLDYSNNTSEFFNDEIMDLFNRSGGTFGGFRVRNYSDYSTNDSTGEPTSLDQECVELVQSEDYQIVVWFGDQGATDSYRRRIRKPEIDSALVAISSIPVDTGFSVDYTTGVISFSDTQRNVSVITKGTQTVVALPSNPYAVGNTVVFSDVEGMEEINGLRGSVLVSSGNNITVDIDSQLFTDYTSGGRVNTAPQSEVVTAGCFYDIPMRFESDLSSVSLNQWDTVSSVVSVVEVLNP